MSDTIPTEPPANRPATGKTVARLKRAVLALSILITTVCLLLYWLIGTSHGLHFAVHSIPAWFGTTIRTDKLEGSLWQGFRADNILIDSESSSIRIDKLLLQWQSDALWHRHLHINRLAAGDIHIDSRNAPPREQQQRPIRLPESISLPFAIDIEQLEIGTVRNGETVLLHPSALAYVYNHKEHRLDIQRLNTPWQNASGKITLNTTPPFALIGDIRSEGVTETGVSSGRIALGGHLDGIAVDAHFRTGDTSRLDIEGLLHPFRPQAGARLTRLKAEGSALNPHRFSSALPEADINFLLHAETAGSNALSGSLTLENTRPAPLHRQGLPLHTLNGQLDIDSNGRIRLYNWLASLPDRSSVALAAEIDTEAATFHADTAIGRLDAGHWFAPSLPFVLSGSLHGEGNLNQPDFKLRLAADKTQIHADAAIRTDTQIGQKTLLLNELTLRPDQGGELHAQGSLELFNQQNLQAAVTSRHFNPAAIDKRLPSGSINGTAAIQGILSEGGALLSRMEWADSTLNSAPLNGNAQIRWQRDHLAQADIRFALGRNHIHTEGSLGLPDSRLDIDIDAPELNRFGFGLTGYLKTQGRLSGTFDRPAADLKGHTENFSVGTGIRIRRADFELQASPDPDAPLNLNLDGNQIQTGSLQIAHVRLKAQGSGRRHTLDGNGKLSLDGRNYTLDISAAGGLAPQQNQWQGRIARLDIGGAFNLKLLHPITLNAGSEKIESTAAAWSAMGGQLRIDRLVWQRGQGIQTKGSAHHLHTAQLQRLLAPQAGIQQDLVLAADWDINYSQNATGYLKISQQSGDIILPYRNQSLGLNGTTLDTRLHNGRIDNRLRGQTRYGSADAQLTISQTFGNAIATAPLNGYLKLAVPDLDSLRNLLPHGMSAKGRLNIDTVIGGTVGEPRLNGTAQGHDLYYRDRNTGVILDHGSLNSRFQGRDWLIDSLAFTRKEGRIELNGRVNLTGTTPDVDVTATATAYPILDTPNRKLTLSGNSRLLYTPQRGMALSGALKVDSGHFGFQKAGMPGLDDDVVVEGEDNKQYAEAPTPIALDLDLDLNDNFRFSGEGLDVMLGGNLKLSAQPKEDVKAVGTVNIIRGQYKAYGQDLIIDKGTISFVGDLSNPNLNLRATRNLSPVGAGVEVLGSLDNPRVSLVANEPMSEKDKLTWLILGRASSGSETDEAAVAAAAGAFLVGNINDKIGLVDDFGMTTRRTRNTQTGDLNPAEQIITFGKRLSNELYLGYEYSITSANQAVKLIWQLNSSLQIISRVGTDSSSGELRYTVRFD